MSVQTGRKIGVCVRKVWQHVFKFSSMFFQGGVLDTTQLLFASINQLLYRNVVHCGRLHHSSAVHSRFPAYLRGISSALCVVDGEAAAHHVSAFGATCVDLRVFFSLATDLK